MFVMDEALGSPLSIWGGIKQAHRGGGKGGREEGGGRQTRQEKRKAAKKTPLFKKDIFNILFAWICVGICACIKFRYPQRPKEVLDPLDR